MGWNTGYEIFEATVVGAYDLGKLDKPLLSVLMEPYRGTDIDSGGSQDLTSKDGLSVEEIVIKVWGGELPKKPHLGGSFSDEAEEYYEKRYDAFRKITKEFEWC